MAYRPSTKKRSLKYATDRLGAFVRVRFLFNFLHINDCKEVLLPGDIRGLIELEDKVLVFVCIDSNDLNADDSKSIVFAFDENANEIWKIEEFQDSSGNLEAFSDLGMRNDGKVVVGTTNGTEYVVDLDDGSLSLNNTNSRPW